MRSSSEAARILRALERRHGAEIRELQLDGWSLWPTFRHDVASRLVHQEPLVPGATAPPPPKENLLRIRSLAQLARAGALGLARGKVVTRTLTYNRRLTHEGKRYCVFFDQAVQEIGRERFFVTEGRGMPWHHYETETPVAVDFRDDCLSLFARIFRRSCRLRLEPELPRLMRAARAIHPEAAELLPGIALTFLAHKAAWQAIYRILRPRLVLASVVPNKREAEMAALRTLGIPVLEYQHGDSSEDDISYSYDASLAPFFGTFPLADKMLLFGSYQKEVFVRGGFWPPEYFEIVGSSQLRFSDLHEPPALPFDRSFRNVLVTPSAITPVPEILRNFLTSYVERTGAERIRFHVRPHPSESLAEWNALAARFPGKILVTREQLPALFRAADAQLGIFTTCLREGFHWNLPAYVLQADAWEWSKDLIEGGGARLIPPDYAGSFERFEVPPAQRAGLESLDPAKLEAALFRQPPVR